MKGPIKLDANPAGRRCESRFGGHRCDKPRGHSGAHYAQHEAAFGDGNSVDYRHRLGQPSRRRTTE